MADNEIKLLLNTDPSQLEAGLVKAINNLKKFEAALKKATDIKEIEYLQKSIGALQDKIKQFKPIPNPVTPEFTNNTNKASYALTNLSRVASDAPFGFIAIQNNLDPLLSSFGQLQKETGSVGGALKALGSSLAGPAGIAVGFSVVSALVTTAIQKYGSLSAAVDALFASTDAAAMAQRDLNKANAEAIASVQGELSSINSLVTVAQDLSLSNEARSLAIKKLNQQYPQYLGNLTLENSNTAQTAISVEKLTAALERKAKIAGVEKLITKIAEQQAQAYLDLQQNIKDTDSPLQKFVNGVVQSVTGTSASLKNITSLNKEYGNQEKQLKILQEALTNLTKEQAVNNEITVKGEKDTKKSTSALKEQKKVIEDIFQIGVKLKGSVGKTEEPVITAAFIPNSEQTKAAAQKIKDYYDTLNNAIKLGKESIKQGVIDSFTSVAEAFGSTLGAGGGIGKALAAAGNSLLNIIGGILIQLGKQVILASTLVQALQKALASLFTPQGAAAGLAVGIGLVALGSILKSIKLTKGVAFADGGIVTGPTRALIGEAGPEAVIPLSKLDNIVGGNQNIFVTGILSGENIYLQQQRTSARRSRFV